MAFNSAMEGLQVPPESSWSEGRDSSNSKWNNENSPPSNKPKSKLSAGLNLTLICASMSMLNELICFRRSYS
jgi:hypothetical protein